jgi:hypothetical protein
MAYAYKKRLKIYAGNIFSDRNLKNYDDWSIQNKSLKKGDRAREVVITLIPKKKFK